MCTDQRENKKDKENPNPNNPGTKIEPAKPA